MSELITTYLLNDPNTAIAMDRDAFYNEQIEVINKTGQPTRAVEVISLLLFTPIGEIILQKRSHDKKHNPYLIDKAIGGHISHGDSPNYTIMVETVQELRVPSIVLNNNEDFTKTLNLLRSYLDSVAIVKDLDKKTMYLARIIDGKKYFMAHKIHAYIGAYRGSTRPSDREASGVLYYSLEALKKELKDRPDNFTDDIRFYLDNYDSQIKNFLELLEK